MSKKNETADNNLIAVEEALSKTEHFIEKNKNIITYVVLGIVIVVLAVMGYRKFILFPKEKEAQSQMFVAEQYFEKDSLDKALNGADGYPGFLQIIDDYGSTKQGNLAHYYAGMIYLKKGNFDEAIRHLKKFSSDDKIVAPMALAAIGDAYMELGDMNSALKYYQKAVKDNTNMFTTPLFLMKVGMTYEEMGDKKKAYEAYERIYKEFPRSYEAREVEKFMARTEAE